MSTPLSSDLPLLLSKSTLKLVISLFKQSAGLVELLEQTKCITWFQPARQLPLHNNGKFIDITFILANLNSMATNLFH